MSQANYTNKSQQSGYNRTPFASVPAQKVAHVSGRDRLLNLLYVAACLVLVSATFLDWRDSQATLSDGAKVTLTTTGWDTGWIGGQGLVVMALIAAFSLTIGKIRWLGFVMALPLLGLVGLTFESVLAIYKARTDLHLQHTNLSSGFYLAMVGVNLLIFYAASLYVGIRRPNHP